MTQYVREQIVKVLTAVQEGFTPDPETSDLDDEQPIHLIIPLEVYQRACTLLWMLKG